MSLPQETSKFGNGSTKAPPSQEWGLTLWGALRAKQRHVLCRGVQMLAYEELRGSQGKEIWFRPPRYEARRLFPYRPPDVRVNAARYRLQNISMGGAAVISNRNPAHDLIVGEIVPVKIQQSGLPIFESDARVCRREDTVFGSKIAFNFVGGAINFEKLLNRNVQACITTRASLFNSKTCQLVPKEYRIFCSDVLALLRSYKGLLQDSMLDSELAQNLDQESAFEVCEAQLIEHWRSFWRSGNDIVSQIMNQRDAKEATKEFTEYVLTPEMRLGEIWDRSFSKPLGYPGDFEVMNHNSDS